ncbi:hypothetical protein AALB39_08865 [Lachnospiraceae bacterium 54-53]
MKKIYKLFAVTSLLSISMTTAAFAGVWKQNTEGWRWQDEDNSYPASTWEWIDSNGDGMAECYYFDENGYLLTGTVTPDGYSVNEDGAWMDHGIIRQKAADPFTALKVNQQGFELYQEADRKSSGLPGLDILTDIHMNFSYVGLDIPVSMNTQLKYHDLNTPGMEFFSSSNINMMGIQKTETSFYTNGCYYSDMGTYEKYKMKIGYGAMTSHLTLGGLTGQFGAFLKNVQITKDESGNEILLYSSDSEGLEDHLSDLFDEIWPSLADSDFKINRLDGKAVISPEGYFSKENIFISTTLEEDGDTVGMSMSIDVDYNNPGQAVTIQFPSMEGYEEVVY